MSDFKILLGVKLNAADIKSEIQKHAKNTPIKLNVKLNTKGISNQIKSINTKTPVKLNVKLDTKNIASQIKAISTKTPIKVGVKVDTKGVAGQIKSIGVKTPIKVGVKVDASKAKGEAKNLQNSLAKSIKLKIDDSTFENSLHKAQTEFDKLTTRTGKLKAAMNELNAAYNALGKAGTDEELINGAQRYEAALRKVNNQLKINSRQEKANAADAKLAMDREAFQSKINSWLKQNSAAAKQFGARLQELKAQAQNCDRTTLNHLKNEFKKIDIAAGNAGKKTQSLADRIKHQFSKYSMYFSTASAIMYATQALRDMFNQVVAIDSAMTELKKVTNETNESYNNFLDNAASKAQEIGTTIDGLVSSTAGFARLGWSFDESQELARVANMYAVVGDEVEGVEGATKSLISTMAAYGDEVESMGVIDKFNEIGNNFAISSGGIGEALQRSASSLAAANNSLDESIALITAANTVVQDPDVVGTALKTVSMRVRGAKTEMEEAGLETDGMADSVSKLRAELKALSGVDIMLNETEFKSTYQMMEEIAAKWESMTDIQQASVTELIAGKRQGNIISSLMTNWDVAEDALETSLNSQGSAVREHTKWMESIQAKLQKLKAAWQSLSQSFMQSNFLKGLVDGLTGFVQILDKVVSTLGTIPTLIGAFAGVRSLLGHGIFKFDKDTKSIKIFNDSIKNTSNSIKQFNALSGDKNAQKAFAMSVTESNAGLGKYMSGLDGAKASMGGYIRSLVAGKAAAIGMSLAMTALNAAVTMGISFAIMAIVKGIDKLIVTKKELAESVAEVTDNFRNQHNELTKGRTDFTSMAEKYAKLSQGVDELGRNVSLTADEYAEYQSIVGDIAEQVPSLVTGYDEQGNAILNCKGNVEQLIEAYERLIHVQNQNILTKAGDIEKDFANTLKDSNQQGFWKSFWRGTGYLFEGFGSGYITGESGAIFDELIDYEMTTDAAESLEKMLNANKKQREEIINSLDDLTKDEISDALEKAGIDTGFGGMNLTDALQKALDEDPSKIKGIVDEYFATFNEAVEEQKTIAQAKLSEAFDVSDAISGLNYTDISENLQNVAYQAVNALDYETLAKLSEQGITVENWTTNLLDQLKSISKADDAKLAATFDLQTKFNNGDVTYGEYANGIKEIEQVVDNLNVSDDIKKQLKISFNIDSVTEEYDALLARLTETDEEKVATAVIGFDESEAVEFLNNLTTEEYSVVMNVIEEFDPMSVGEIDRELERLSEGGTVDLTLRPEIDTKHLRDAGWEDAAGDYATIFTNTFSNEAGDVAMNFTPIVTDENGNYVKTLSPEALENYAMDVMSGVREDNLKLQIGAKFEGKDAIRQAEATAERIHQLHEFKYDDDLGSQFQAAIDRAKALEGISFDLNIASETESLDALNTALAESVSGMGLTGETIAALKSRYAELESQGYDLSAMFEETSNGIRLNRQEVAELEQAYSQQKLDEVNSDLEALEAEYNLLTAEINNCSDASERAALYMEREAIQNKIHDCGMLAAQYEGLASAYKAWQDAESAGQERDMYENIIKGFETVDDELSRGWFDDGSIRFLELLTGRTDLATKSGKELKDIYNDLDDTIKNTNYSISDFFTVDDDGNATSSGVYNFLDAIGQLEEEAFGGKDIVKRNKDGNIIGFDFKLAGGDEVIAEALGISEELVQIMVRAADDAGFVVTIEGEYAQFADLKNEAELATSALKELKTKGLDELEGFELDDFDFNFASEDINEITNDLERANKVLDQFRNKDGTIKRDKDGNYVEGAEEALSIAQTLLITKNRLEEPAYMSIDTSGLEENLQKPVEQLQEFEKLSQEKTILNLDPTGENKKRISEINSELDSITTSLFKLDTETKIDLGIDGMTPEEIREELENGKIEVPAELSIEANMDKSLEDLLTLGLFESGFITKKEAKVRLGIDAEVDNEKAKEKTNNAISEIFGKKDDKTSGDKIDKNVNVEVKAGEVDASDVEEKAEDAIEKASNEKSMVDKEVELEVTVDEYREIIQDLENADKDVVIDVKVKGLDDVKELNKNIDLATNIDGDINALSEYVEGAKELSKLDNEIESDVTANVHGNVTSFLMEERRIDNLKVFSKAASGLKGVGNVSSTITAKISDDSNITKDKLSKLKTFKNLANTLKSIGNVAIKVTASVASKAINDAVTLLTKVKDSGAFKDYNASVKVTTSIDSTAVDTYIATQKTGNGKIIWENNTVAVDSFKRQVHEATGKVKWDNDTTNVKTSFKASGTVTWTSGNNVQVKVVKLAKGTAYTDGSALSTGTSGRAFAHGNWGIKGNGVALGGELGQELVVRNGRFFTIGDQGAEFFQYKKNDIIFNAAQTASLFKYGGIKGADPRGKVFASGSAFAEGVAFDGGSTGTGGIGRVDGKSVTIKADNITVSSKNGKSTKTTKSKDTKKKSKDTKDDFEETFDWIEIAIERLERAIDRLDKQANRTYKSWSDRNKKLAEEIPKVREEINLQEKAYKRYIKEANSVSLSSSWKKKVQNGQVNIQDIKDEDLAEKIKEYQTWYEKALDCKDAILELKDTEMALYKQRFDNVVSEYDGDLARIEHRKSMYDEFINRQETDGHIVSTKYYDKLASLEQSNIKKLTAERDALIQKRADWVKAGGVVGSEDWDEMTQEINATTLSIEEGKTALIEYANAIRDIEWEQFDLIQERISNVTKEAEFMIELMSNDKLYEDDGQLTNQGMATMGLHGQNHNVYMNQADQYAAEIANIDKDLADDPYDKDLLNRRQELLELQQESILAAEAEKDAIRDMVEEGIELELDALQEKIDKHNEALDSAKDLYDYQKKVKEQTKEIADLEKQMAAYAGDNSEEARAKVQELKVSLEEAKENLKETEYEKYISGQEELLDSLYSEYETILNTRLDNVDALLTDMITEVNTNASTISTALTTEADKVGYTLSEEMNSIWSADGDTNKVLATYGTDFGNKLTTVNATLDSIKGFVQQMVDASDTEAETNKTQETKTNKENTTYTKPKSTTKKTTPKKTTTNKNNNKTIKKGGKIKAAGAKIYDYKGDKSGETQYYKKDPIYKVLKVDGSWIQARYHKLKSGVTGWFKKKDVKAYKTGAKSIKETMAAWTQENGREFIVRPSDGAILTPLAKKDSVLNANASNNIWDMANNPAEFIKDNLDLGVGSVPNNINMQNSYTQNLENVVFNMPNVRSYDEMISAMQKDKNFEKLILSMSIDRVAGKSSLAKGKAIR